jgi:hypothetical protein
MSVFESAEPVLLAVDPGSEYSALVYFVEACDKPGNMEIRHKEYVSNEELIGKLSVENLEAVLIETPRPRAEPVSSETFQMAIWIGRFVQVCDARDIKWGHIFYERVCLAVVRSTRMTDPQRRLAIIEIFGGEAIAIGGKRCDNCDNRGSFSGGRGPCDECNENGQVPGKKAGTMRQCPKCKGKREVQLPRVLCEPCGGTGRLSPHGPLYSGMNDHIWSALAVAITWLEDQKLVQSLNPKSKFIPEKV